MAVDTATKRDSSDTNSAASAAAPGGGDSISQLVRYARVLQGQIKTASDLREFLTAFAGFLRVVLRIIVDAECEVYEALNWHEMKNVPSDLRSLRRPGDITRPLRTACGLVKVASSRPKASERLYTRKYAAVNRAMKAARASGKRSFDQNK